MACYWPALIFAICSIFGLTEDIKKEKSKKISMAKKDIKHPNTGSVFTEIKRIDFFEYFHCDNAKKVLIRKTYKMYER